MKKKKCYIGTVAEVNGGFEYETQYLFATSGKPDRYADKVTMNWRGGSKDDYDENMNGYWSDHTIIRDYGCKEVPQEDFDVLRKYLAVL